jgi:hypothetical protein
VTCARDQGAIALEFRALTSLLDLRLSRGQATDVPDELRLAMADLACESERSDLITARELLARAPS